MRVLAIDQGTSATKAVVIDDGVAVAEAESAVSPIATDDGGVEQDAEQLWASVLDAGRRALARAGGRDLDAVGLGNQGETVLAWDRTTGRPFGPAWSWQDRRATDVTDALAPQADELARITGLSLDPYFVAPKMVRLRHRHGPTATITTTDTWLLHRMCGAFVTDVSTASRTLLMDLDTLTWSTRAAELFDIDPSGLPVIVANTATVGTTEVFGRSVPVSGTCVDQQAALFAEGCVRPGDVKCTYGTGAFLLANTGRQSVRSTSGLVGCVAWVIDDDPRWCLDGQVYTVGAAVTWLERLGIIAEPADLDRLGGAVASSGGVEFVPALAGLGSPFWAPQAKGAFTGLTLATEATHLVRSVIDGIAAQVAVLGQAAALDLGAPLQRLRVDGGLTRSRTLLQTQADLCQAPVEVYPSPHATALGVGAFAALGAGASDDEAIASWVPVTVIEPQMDADRAAERLDHWRRAVDATLATRGDR